ncbi:MMPL family transporter [Kineosporia rhizophila]|uniref:MMPL family transporter n=1 Tax=Kineosporia TaxID=49184 RepID=UPI001E48EF52|nr:MULTISPECIES: MMPL family transporter [Kineosporia]MCE0539786.1 MMPL family transporter [Kineosporia rhizophila]GLY13375.1 membrane protein [Kineosporia sp. NBRC 101677]
MKSIATFVVRHRWWVVGFWSAALLAGVFASSAVPDRLSYDFSLPGQEGWETSLELKEAYGMTGDMTDVPVYTAPEGESIAEHRDEVAAIDAALAQLPGAEIVGYGGTGDERFLTDDGRSTFSLLLRPSAEGFEDPVAEQLEQTLRQAGQESGLQVGLTGYGQLALDSAEDTEGPSVLAETLIGGFGALIVLLFVFASFLALVPLLVAAVAILSTFLVVLGLTEVTDVSFVVQFLVALIGLGVAIDYSLLVVSRWREERAHGSDNEEAVITAVRTAGHAVLASGVTVAISLIALVVVPVPLLRSMGFGGMLIPLMSTLVVLTLLPALLSLVGPRVDWPRIRKENHASAGWSAWARGVVRHRWVAAGVGTAALALAIVPVFGLQFGLTDSDALSDSGPGHEKLVTLEQGGVGSGVLSPITAAVASSNDVPAIVSAAEKVDGVRMAVPLEPSPAGLTAVLVVPDEETVDNTSVAIADDVRAELAGLPGYEGLAGAGPTVQDYQAAVFDRFPYVLALIALITFVLLVRTFRSVLLPLKAVLLNLLSLAAVFGLATWFWQEGNGSEAIFGVSATGAMEFWLPVLIFAFLFGLSMDYEVFLLARMREEYDRTGSTDRAIEEGLGRTGRLITSAALILFFSFAALAATPDTPIKVVATALGVGILLDATLVRMLLVPALVSLFGKYNWWLPAWLARPLLVEPSPLRPEPVRSTPEDEGEGERRPVRVG